MSNLQSIVRSAFANILTAVPNAVVTIISGEETAEGIKDTSRTEADLMDAGERGATTGIVRVDASELTEPSRGATITVNGDSVFVIQTRLDPIGAILVIEYSKQRPVT